MCDFVSINQPQIGGRLIENELPRFWRSNVEKIECTVINAFTTKPPEKVRSKNIHAALQKVVHNANKPQKLHGHTMSATTDIGATNAGNT